MLRRATTKRLEGATRPKPMARIPRLLPLIAGGLAVASLGVVVVIIGVITIGALFATRPLLIAPVASKFGTVSPR